MRNNREYRAGAIVQAFPQTQGYGINPMQPAGACTPLGDLGVCPEPMPQCWAQFTLINATVAIGATTVFNVTSSTYRSFTPKFIKSLGTNFDDTLINSVRVSGVDSFDGAVPISFFNTSAGAGDMIPVNWKAFDRQTPMLISVTNNNAAPATVILIAEGLATR